MMQTRRFLIGVAVLCTALTLLSVSAAGAQTGVTVSIAAPADVDAGSDFAARVNVDLVTDLDTFQIDVTYDPGLIQVIGSESGSQGVSSGLIDTTIIPADMWIFVPTGTPGKMRILGNLPGLSGVSGSGYLCEVNFHVIGSDCHTSDIDIDAGRLGDTDGDEITGVTWTGTSVHIVGEAPTPPPTAAPTATPTPTAEPTAPPTATPTATAGPTTPPTASPTATAGPTAPPTAPTTAGPTATAAATPTPAATTTATPAPTPVPTPAPTPTPKPTGTLVEVGDVDVAVGGTASVDVRVTDFPDDGFGLGCYTVRIDYDPALIEVTGVSAGDAPFDAPIFNIEDDYVGITQFCTAMPGPTGDLRVAILEFESLAEGETALTLQIETLANTNGDDIEATPVNGTVNRGAAPASPTATAAPTASPGASPTATPEPGEGAPFNPWVVVGPILGVLALVAVWYYFGRMRRRV